MFDEYGVAVARNDAAGQRLRRLARSQQAERIFPGVYLAPGARGNPLTLVRAAQAWCPDAVIVGWAAARLTYWPAYRGGDIELATPHRRTAPQGIVLHRRSVDPEWVVERLPFRFSHPAFTAAYLAGTMGGDAVDEALRNGVSLDDILRAPLQRWPGREQRRRILRDSRSNPWSALERLGHRTLHEAGIEGWRANRPVRTRSRTWICDVVFAKARLIIEFDGFAFHSDPAAFELDRAKHNDLTAAGWRVLHVTWRQLTQDPQSFTALVRRLLARDHGTGDAATTSLAA